MATKYLDSTGLSHLWSKLKDYFQPKLVSGTNIKTINNTSLLGSGNISISGGSVSTDLFSVQNVSISASGSSSGAVSNTKNVTKAGYYPLGIVGTSVETAGAYSRGFYLSNVQTGSCTLNVRLQVTGSGTKNCNANILWMKVT